MTASAQAPWLRRLTSPFAAGLVLVIFYVVMLASLRDKSATFDEPGHATAGYAYWKFGNYRIDPENGNLPQRWIALPLLGDSFRFPASDSKGWRNSDTWTLADEWFNRLDNDTGAMLARGRAACGLIAVALGAMVWLWSRQLFGPTGGMLSLLLYGLNPAILANGALMKDDIPGALAFLAACWAFWAMLEKFSPTRVLLSAVVAGLLFVTKASAVLFVPMALVLTAARLLSDRPLMLDGARNLANRGRQVLVLAGGAIVHALVIFGVIWAAYGFHYSASAPGENSPTRFGFPWAWALDQPSHLELIKQLELSPGQQERVHEIFESYGALDNQWSFAAVDALQTIRDQVLTPAQAAQLDALKAAPPPSTTARFVAFARDYHLLPEAYIFGCAHVWKLSKTRNAFLNGEFRVSGWWWFFPYVFAVKTPLALFGMIGLALAGTAGRWSTPLRTLPLWTLLTVYWAIAITSHINIGHRHLLPVYPPLFILCGAAARWLEPDFAASGRRRAASLALGALLAACAVEIIFWFPNYLAFFNGLVSPTNGYRHLVDSSLDWGQDLPAAKRYLDRLPVGTPTYLAYFGMGSPEHEGIKAIQIYGHLGFEVAAEPALKIFPGLSREKDSEKIAEILRHRPAYDPALISMVTFGSTSSVLLVKRPSALRLNRGTYLISATLIQPVHNSETFGPWNAAFEAKYQRLRAIVRPLLADDPNTRASALEKLSARTWLQVFDDFQEYRFARLAAYLRQREPDDNINYSILVYHLTDDDIARALDGPSP